MANISAPFGFRQYLGTGSPPTFELVAFSNGGINFNTAAIFYGDPVQRLGAGDGSLIPSPTATAVAFVGVFQGCKYLSTSQKRTNWQNYWPGTDLTTGNNATMEAYVVTDEGAQYVVQSDATGATQLQMGSNVNHNIGVGTTANGVSGAFITPGTTAAVTATLPWRMMRLILDPPGVQGSQAGAFNYVMVTPNNIENRALTSVVA